MLILSVTSEITAAAAAGGVVLAIIGWLLAFFNHQQDRRAEELAKRFSNVDKSIQQLADRTSRSHESLRGDIGKLSYKVDDLSDRVSRMQGYIDRQR